MPVIDLPVGIPTQSNLLEAVKKADCLVLAVPSNAFREITTHLSNFSGVVVSVTKGIEYDSGLTMSGIVDQNMPLAQVGALSGPTLA